MGKNYNSADAFRKQQKAKELKKNAADRKKRREDKSVKQDTRDLESEISHLKSRDKLSDEGKERLAKLEADLKFVLKQKEKYVAAHPEARDKVFGNNEKRRGRYDAPEHEDGDEFKPDPMAHLYNPDGTLRDPKKSAYYDPTYNPFGVPPPGMPYRERSPVAGEESESSDDDDDDDDSDEDIIMPEGPRPDEESDEDSDDSMDIPLPEGPPPPRPPPALPVMPPGMHAPGFGPGHGRGRGRGGHGPQHMGGRPGAPYPPRVNPANPGGWGHLMPSGPGPIRSGPQAGSLPPRPGSLPAPPSSLPAKPGSAPGPVPTPALPAEPTTGKPAAAAPAAIPEAATISAAPQLRDLRKEATVFVPRGVKKKQAPGGLAPVNAAPHSGAVDAEGDAVRVRAPASSGLMGKLSGVLGPSKPADEGEDEYERFLEGLE